MRAVIHPTPHGWQAVPGSKWFYKTEEYAASIQNDLAYARDPNITAHMAAGLISSSPPEVVDALYANPALPLLAIEDPLWPGHCWASSLYTRLRSWDFPVPEEELRRLALAVDQMHQGGFELDKLRARIGLYWGLGPSRFQDALVHMGKGWRRWDDEAWQKRGLILCRELEGKS